MACAVLLLALNKKTAAKTLVMKQDEIDQVIDKYYFLGNLITALIIITNSKFSNYI